MTAIPRLNTVIRALEQGEVAITTFVSPPTVDNAIAVSTASYDGVIFESEHNPYEISELRDGMQYLPEPPADPRARDPRARGGAADPSAGQRQRDE